MIIRSGHLSRSAMPPSGLQVDHFRQGWSFRSLWHNRIPRRWVKMLPLLAFVGFFSVVVGMSLNQAQQHKTATSQFPPTRQTQQHTHDPTIIRVGDEFYLYNVGEHIFIHTAKSMDGPWEMAGTVLDANSVINKGDRAVPWAPSVITVDGVYYCYYSVSRAGCRDSAVGVATSKSPGPGQWVDHGLVVQTGTGNGSDIAPYNKSNAIDPNVLITAEGKAYLTFGSYWSGIWQVPLSKDLLSPASSTEPDARHLAYEPVALGTPNRYANDVCGDPTGPHAIEGASTSYRDGYYYLWFSHGRCCNLNANRLPPAGQEYSIRVGRSKDPRGPFVDQSGTDLLDGGGTPVYGSNGNVYAPGGQGVIRVDDTDILYYHYLNLSIGVAFSDAYLGFNPLKYVNGWPVAQP